LAVQQTSHFELPRFAVQFFGVIHLFAAKIQPFVPIMCSAIS
jgi:hypothetical protein